MNLQIEVDEDSDEIRHDIKSIDIELNFPFLPRYENTWCKFNEYSMKRMRYLNLKDTVAYQKLVKNQNIDFKPSRLINLSPSDRIFLIFEDYISLKISPPSSISSFNK